MKRSALARIGVVVGLTACHPPPVPPSTVVYAIANHTDKALAVVVALDNAEEHQPRPVPVDVVKRAMQASSFFTEEDTNELAQPIADTLPEMAEEEYLRVVAWEANQPRYYYLYIRGGKLRLYFQRGSQIIERHETTIPAESVALAAPNPATDPATDPATSPPPTHATPPPPAGPDDAQPTPTEKPAGQASPPKPRPTVARRRPAAEKSTKLTRLSEDQVREKLRGLDQLRDRSLVSTAEYQEKRQEILNRL